MVLEGVQLSEVYLQEDRLTEQNPAFKRIKTQRSVYELFVRKTKKRYLLKVPFCGLVSFLNYPFARGLG